MNRVSESPVIDKILETQSEKSVLLNLNYRRLRSTDGISIRKYLIETPLNLIELAFCHEYNGYHYDITICRFTVSDTHMQHWEVTGSRPTFSGISHNCFSQRYAVSSTEGRKIVCVALQETATFSVSGDNW